MYAYNEARQSGKEQVDKKVVDLTFFKINFITIISLHTLIQNNIDYHTSSGLPTGSSFPWTEYLFPVPILATFLI